MRGDSGPGQSDIGLLPFWRGPWAIVAIAAESEQSEGLYKQTQARDLAFLACSKLPDRPCLSKPAPRGLTAITFCRLCPAPLSVAQWVKMH